MTSRKKVLVVSPKNRTVYNFRGALIEDLVAAGYEVHVSGPDDKNVDRIMALGAEFHAVPLSKTGLSVRQDALYAWRLWRLMRRLRPVIVFGYTIKPVVFGSLAARAAGVPRIVSMITGVGFVFSSQSRKARAVRGLVVMLYRAALSSASEVVFQNVDDRDEFVRRRLVDPEKTRAVNGSGVDVQRFSPQPFPPVMTFSMLARVVRSKGVVEFLEAAREVKKWFPEARFRLLGSIEPLPDALARSDLQPYIEDGSIEYLTETDDVRPFLAESSVFVLPSYREGVPRTVLEAMSMGRPILTTDAPGCRETVQEGRNGFLVRPQDAHHLADRLAWFLANPDAIPRMGEESRTIVLERFDVRLVNQDMLAALGASPTDKFGEDVTDSR